MNLLEYFRANKVSSASIAKERLQVLVAHERNAARCQPSYLPQLKEEILDVIRKYVNVEKEAISVHLEQDENQEILELNILLPEQSNKKL
jgi:cell division topological specificity factor